MVPGRLWYIPEFRRIWYVLLLNVKHLIFMSHRRPGPGNCLGLLASKSSPTAVRGQFYGLAAAVGKVGAFVGTWGRVY